MQLKLRKIKTSKLVGMNLLGAEGSSFATDNSGLVGVSFLADGTSFTTENSGLIGVSLLGETASFSEHDDDRSTMFTQSPRGRNSPGRLFNSQNHNHNHSIHNNSPSITQNHHIYPPIYKIQIHIQQNNETISKTTTDPKQKPI
jgi:hypothetical protein